MRLKTMHLILVVVVAAADSDLSYLVCFHASDAGSTYTLLFYSVVARLEGGPRLLTDNPASTLTHGGSLVAPSPSTCNQSTRVRPHRRGPL
jgi:hypothetical protein